MIHFFEDVPELGDRHVWPGTAKEGVQALAEDWEHFISRIAALGDKRLLAPMGLGPGGWADETYLKLALHALDEVAHHGGEIGLLRDLYLREGVSFRRRVTLSGGRVLPNNGRGQQLSPPSRPGHRPGHPRSVPRTRRLPDHPPPRPTAFVGTVSGSGEVRCGSAAPRRGAGNCVTSHDGAAGGRRQVVALPAERLS